MPQKPVQAYFLHVYNVTLGLWAHTTLGSGVLPHTAEAMNYILRRDAITAFIGTRLEFGAYCLKLENTFGTALQHCWTSLPASTILSKLGLCQNMLIAGRPRLVFVGSPLTIMVAFLLEMEALNCLQEVLEQIESSLVRTGFYNMEESMLNQLGLTSPWPIGKICYDEALSYINVESDYSNAAVSSSEMAKA